MKAGNPRGGLPAFYCIENSDEGGVLTKTTRLAGGSGKAFADEQSRRSGGSLVQRELSPQATEGLFLSCEFCNPSASRCSAPPFTQGRRKVVVVAFATAVQICKCQTFSEGFQPCQHHALIGLSKPPALPVVMTAARKAFAHI